METNPFQTPKVESNPFQTSKSETNPYQSPEADFGGPDLPDGLAGMTPKEVQKLYYRSSNISAIAGVFVIGMLGISGMLFFASTSMENPGVKLVLLASLVFYGFAVAGLAMRTDWGRVLGIIACIISLISVPLGTIVGIVGLVAFFKAKILFGPDRVTHKVVKEAYMELKRAKMIPFFRLW